MKQAAFGDLFISDSSLRVTSSQYVLMVVAGLFGTLGFAPFHIPGFTILSLALLFSSLLNSMPKQAFKLGFAFGMGYFGLGVSWVIVSIHDYGQINYFCAGLITLAFLIYLALFPAIVAWAFKWLQTGRGTLLSMLSFSTLWCVGEVVRAHLMTGFPWLLVGTSQIDTPLKSLAPVVGIYGLSLLCVFSATLLAFAVRSNGMKRSGYLLAFVLLIIGPSVLKHIEWTEVSKNPVSIGAVQANLSMRDKWDEALFWSLLTFYEKSVDKLMGKQLIILPESAIPLPASYLTEYLNRLNDKALKANSALMLGILQPSDDNEINYYNAIITLGHAQGLHIKHQLVPFGEYIPSPFVAINRWLNLPEPNIAPGKINQPLVSILEHPIASLICYEVAYPALLRQQLPTAQWIVSISDNGWFGRSLASYQQLQMSQLLSLLTGRYQVVVNNDGLSSIINEKGEIVNGLPPFSAGLLEGEIFPAQGTTPWVLWSDYPVLFFCSLFLIFLLILRLTSHRKQ